MLGAIAGDIIGSVFEHRPTNEKDFPLFTENSVFTDDTVLTVAVANAILTNTDYGQNIISFGRKFPNAGYGGFFFRWLFSDNPEPYNSFGNGSAMRVSPVGFAVDSVDSVLEEAKKSAEITHNHREGIKGAQAVAVAILLARQGKTKQEIREDITRRFGYDLQRTVDDIRPGYHFDVTCQGSVPESIIAFLDATDFEDAIRNAISLGGDADTMACIAGAIAQAFYQEISAHILKQVKQRLTPMMIDIVNQFNQKFGVNIQL